MAWDEDGIRGTLPCGGTLTRATEQRGKQSFCVPYLHQQLTIVRQITNVRVRDGKMTHHMPLVIRVLHSKTCEQRKVKRPATGPSAAGR